MICIIQLVSSAQVKASDVILGSIDYGILALIGFEKTDNEHNTVKMIDKIINCRIFPDQDGKTNLSLQNINGGLLLVPQFTLVAETEKGTRPGFSIGMPPNEAKILFAALVNYSKKIHPKTEMGLFGAIMSISLCNEGPATFILRS